MREGDGDANYAYFALHKLHILPSVFLGLPRKEKAFVIAAIDERIKAEKAEADNLKRK